ncbi:hypothetical protein BCR35DRAFT_334723 [Leucosporidium creatinivorum]|uniref:SH3 domain-containing protein n=1 Tax=Leucosporidium creatinivorum TaxID=106004 RepID=A0A1Y2DZH2_9BASI|nr:hypothetical protein BCR35DRAFT_334723 [Leucosporidium creatinivorum]
MKGIRRSLNKDRIGAPTPTYSSLPTAGFPNASQSANKPVQPTPAARPLVAPAPPKRVIRAIADYRAASAQELSFEKGDFFHVVSDEGGDDWFDAANPMTGARGLVPAEHFQVLGRNVRETAQQANVVRKGSSASAGGYSNQPSPTYGAPSMAQQQQHPQQAQQHQRGPSYNGGGQQGYVPTSSAPTPSTFMPATAASSNPTSPPLSNASRNSRPQSSNSAAKPQPLYGIVQYNFVAERADELDAKRGEPIIVIAQSNHEWFVAKPIGRLGGPGLIPVAFVEIQDMTTGKPVENVEELIRSAVVPKVEEWKKMTADYKSASIPLGRFDFAGASASTTGGATSPSSAQSPTGAGPSGARSPYDDNARYSAVGTPHTNSSSRPESDAYGDSSTDHQRYSYTRERRQYGLVTSASVESFHHEEGSFWFHLRAFFSTGASLVLYRLYQDFYDFQIALMDEFPVEAGRIPPGGEDSGRKPERILPMMPGPTDYEDEVVCAQRVHDLSLYLGDLCGLPERIRSSGLMYEFLVPRAGDVEVAVGNGRGDEPGGGAAETIDGQYGELVEYLDQMDGGGQNGQRASQQGTERGAVEEDLARLSINGSQQGGEEYGSYQEPRTQSRQSQGSAGYSSSNDQGSYQQTYQFNNPPPQQHSAPAAPMGNANQNVPFIKIKIFHRNTDDLIAIRVPPTVSHASLLDKVRERLGNDVVNLRYREEVGSTTPSGAQVVMAGGARLVGVETDEDLERWIRGGSRLVLYAD